jgi:predicted AlkP superfamily phosphohydrolase/phosphomutase
MHQLDWDFSMVVLRLTDEIPHYFWHWMDKTHPAHCHAEAFLRNAVLDCYCKADELVGKLMETVDDETIVIVMSDHGFGPLYKDVYLNEWLRQQGFLRLRSRLTLRAVITRLLQRLGVTHTQIGHALSRLGLHWLRGTLRDRLGSWAELFPQDAQPRVAELVDWSRTQAYSVGYIGQIYVNLIGRDPQGIVAPGEEYEQVREELITQLQKLVDPEDEQPVVDQVYKKEEIYSGRFMLEAPDLLVLMRGLSYITRQGYELSKHRLIFAQPPTHETGGHRMQGILLARGPHIKHGAMIRPRIVDLAPTILHILGCPVPQDIDGLVLRELLRSDFLENHPIVYTNDVQPRSIMVSELTKEEERELLSRLRAFGYIDDRSLTSK